MLAVFMVISFNFTGSSAQDAAQNPQTDQSRQTQMPGQQPGQPGQNGPNGPRPPEVHFIGFAVESEEKFEMANFFLLPPAPPAKNGQENIIKKPDAVIAIGKQEYFVVEARIETEEIKIDQQQGPQGGQQGDRHGRQENAGGTNAGRPKPVKIKSCEGKISKSYFERANMPPAPGQNRDNSEMPKGKAEIVGDIKIAEVEKEVGKDGKGKVSVMYGTMSTGEQKFTLYLEPRIMQPPPPGQGQGQNRQNQQNQNANQQDGQNNQ